MPYATHHFTFNKNPKENIFTIVKKNTNWVEERAISFDKYDTSDNLTDNCFPLTDKPLQVAWIAIFQRYTIRKSEMILKKWELRIPECSIICYE